MVNDLNSVQKGICAMLVINSYSSTSVLHCVPGVAISSD